MKSARCLLQRALLAAYPLGVYCPYAERRNGITGADGRGAGRFFVVRSFFLHFSRPQRPDSRRKQERAASAAADGRLIFAESLSPAQEKRIIPPMADKTVKKRRIFLFIQITPFKLPISL